ncbi:MAG: 1-acyl-sn-glycerol-3-phosphate acyltransferase [Sphingobacteriales bacterium]|nr:MAG: 1-acyl-sn-glycerol-3-phosphate acyltransferase [Sphingobacteriales bacterium]
MKSAIQPFYTLFVLATFVASLLIIFPVFFILGIRDTPGARQAIWSIVHYWAVGWLSLIGQPIRVSGNYPRGQKYVIVANHISYMDTVNIYAAIPQYFRTLAKKEMVKIPVFGFVYKQLAILVDRSSAESRAKSMRLMWRQIRNECSIAVFPEGTFNETEAPLKAFYDGAFRLALNTGTPILPLLFPDTVDRWHFSGWWKLWPGRNRAIFLEPVSVEGLGPQDMERVKQQVWDRMSEQLAELTRKK